MMKSSLLRIVFFSLAALPLLGQSGGLTLTSNNYRLSTKMGGTGTVLVYDGSSFSLKYSPGYGDSWQTVPEANYFRICAGWQDSPVCIGAGAGTNISQLVLTPKSNDWKQAWSMTATPDGYYTIQNIGTGVALPDVWKLTPNTAIAAGPPINVPTVVYGSVTIQGGVIADPPPPPTIANSAQDLFVQQYFSCSGGDIIKDFCLPAGTVAPSRSYIRTLERLAQVLSATDDPKELRARLFGLVLQIAKKFPSQWTPDEQGIMNWLTYEVRNNRLAVAQKTLDEYRRWKAGPWSYQPPAGFDFDAYLIPPANSPLWMQQSPAPPVLWQQSLESWLSDTFFGTVLSSGFGPLITPLPPNGAAPPAFPVYAEALVHGSTLGSDEGRTDLTNFLLDALQTRVLFSGSSGSALVTAAMTNPQIVDDLMTLRNLELQKILSTGRILVIPSDMLALCNEYKVMGWQAQTVSELFPEVGRVFALRRNDLQSYLTNQAQGAFIDAAGDPLQDSIDRLSRVSLDDLRLSRAAFSKAIRMHALAMASPVEVLTLALMYAVQDGVAVFGTTNLETTIQGTIDQINSSPLPDVRYLLSHERLSGCTSTGCASVVQDIVPSTGTLTAAQMELLNGPIEIMHAFLKATSDLADRPVPASTTLWTQSGARDIGIDGDDNVWVIGQDPRGSEGNYGVWFYNQAAQTWSSVPNYGVAISGMPYPGVPEALLVQADGKLVVQSPSATTDIWPSDKTKDVAMGQPYSAIWRTGSTQQGNDWKIWEFPDGGSSWMESVPGTNAAALRIAVGPNNDPYVVNTSNQIYFFSQSQKKWSRLPGAANDIGGGLDGTVWVIGNTSTGDGNYRIYRWDPVGWTWHQHPSGKGVRIAVDKEGNPWVVQANGAVVRYLKQ